MRKIELHQPPDILLTMENGYKIAAITYVIEMVMINRKSYGLHLNSKESAKVQSEIDKIIDSLSDKRQKLHK